MAERIPCPPDRVIEVAIAALCDARTVERYLAGLHMLRATEELITRAIRELPEQAQMEIQVEIPGRDVAGFSSAARAPGPESVVRTRITARDGTVFDLPPEFAPPGNGLVASIPAPPPTESAQPGAEPKRRGSVPPRPRLRLGMPDGLDVPAPEGHWWEERTA
jgi:hypothetical protein